MGKQSSNGWRFLALLFGALLAGVVGLYIYKQQNPKYDPWEEPWENSSSPVNLDSSDKDSAKAEDSDDESDSSASAATATEGDVAK